MVDEKKLNEMYEMLIEKNELTTKQLNNSGFTSQNLSELVENGILQRVKRGYYSLLSVEGLFLYGKKLISLKQYDKASVCFQKCYALNPNHFGTCFEMFINKIKACQFRLAFDYFEYCYNNENKLYSSDNRLYLYLLNIITEIPKEYQNIARTISFSEIKIDFEDKRYSNIEIQNKIRLCILNQKFTYAYQLLNDLVVQTQPPTTQDFVLRLLLQQAILKQKEEKKHVLNLVKNQQYEEAIAYFEKIQEYRNLSKNETYDLKLIKVVNNIINYGIMPIKSNISSTGFFESINVGNYEQALSNVINNPYNTNYDNNLEYMLLVEINEYLSKDNSSVFSTVEPNVLTVEEVDDRVNEITLFDVLNDLMNNGLDTSFDILRKYLETIKKAEYEFLIIDLIKISIIENDCGFTKPMTALTYISTGKFEFNISEYIQSFYEYLALKKYDIARIYLDIIAKSDKLGQSLLLIKNLEEVLNKTEQIVETTRKEKTKNIKEVLPVKQKSGVEKCINDELLNDVSSHSYDYNETDKSKVDIILERDYNFVNKKIDEAREKGIALLNPMDSSRRKQIHKIVDRIPDVVSFSIGQGKSRQVVLRYKPCIDEYINIDEIIEDASRYYRGEKYDLCIEKYRKLLKIKNPRSWLYNNIGLAYWKKKEINTAIEYLTVGTLLSREEGIIKEDYTDLIIVLKGLIPEEDKKVNVKMNVEEFTNEIGEYYGIQKIEDITKLILSGTTIEVACTMFGLDEEQQLIVCLILAREYYIQESFAIGDRYLKIVEKSKNKTKFINSLYNETRTNKKFYKSRNTEGHKSLILNSK